MQIVAIMDSLAPEVDFFVLLQDKLHEFTVPFATLAVVSQDHYRMFPFSFWDLIAMIVIKLPDCRATRIEHVIEAGVSQP
jgi:hypothetical protein